MKDGNDRFLFEMATGTGKTLTAAAVIKLFLRSGNASRVLFLVDRLELEEQARKMFAAMLSADYSTVIYKERRDDYYFSDSASAPEIDPGLVYHLPRKWDAPNLDWVADEVHQMPTST